MKLQARLLPAGRALIGAGGLPPVRACAIKGEIMELDDFLKLTPEEQTAFLLSAADAQRTLADLEAERDSLKAENEKFLQQITAGSEELKKTKELNYTLARQLSREPEIDVDKAIAEILKGE